MKNNVDTALEKMYLNNVVVDLETQELVKLILTLRPDFTITCTMSNRSGNLAAELDKIFGSKEKKYKLIYILKEYVEKKKYRLVDLFRQFDKDNSMSVTRQEFRDGLKGIGVPLDDQQLTQLINLLDEDGDGEIDYGEFAWINEVE